LGKRHDLVWGLGYRRLWNDSDSTSRTPLQYNPPDKTAQLFSIFAQDEITLIKDRVRLILGSKLEHNDYSGYDLQPTIRVSWTPESNQTVWGAVSGAAVTTGRTHEDIRVNVTAFPTVGGTPALLAVFGNKEFESQRILAYEAGYRVQAHNRLSLDIATFYNRYDRLLTAEPGMPFFEVDPFPPHLVIPLVLDNRMRGRSYGVESSVVLDVTPAWRLAGSYSFIRTRLKRDIGSLDTTSKEAGEGYSPQHQFQIHSNTRLPGNLELDASLYRVSRLVYPSVPGYSRLDLRLGWRFAERVELSAVAQNLLDDRHLEFGGKEPGVQSSFVKRSAYGKLTWTF
jgi:iron complex outermembrane receptor protein